MSIVNLSHLGSIFTVAGCHHYYKPYWLNPDAALRHQSQESAPNLPKVNNGQIDMFPSMAIPAPIEYLPTEILLEIFDSFCQEERSEQWLYEEPLESMQGSHAAEGRTASASRTSRVFNEVKAISYVSSRWRAVILPRLFRSIIWKPGTAFSKPFDVEIGPLLQFLVRGGLNRHVKTITIMIDRGLEDWEDCQLYHHLRGAHLGQLWSQLFSVIDPLRLTIIAPPAALAAALQCGITLTDAWSFDTRYHILSLARSKNRGGNGFENSKGGQLRATALTVSSQSRDQGITSLLKAQTMTGSMGLKEKLHNGWVGSPPDVSQCSCLHGPPVRPLFLLRSWTTVFLNEGSSIPAYQRYDFFNQKPPSILAALLGIGECPNNHVLLPPSVAEFNYIAIFPLASHVHAILSNLPRLDRLFIQLTPRVSSSMLQGEKALKQVNMADLWLERDTVYRDLTARLAKAEPRGNWRELKVFELGDSADTESWNTVMDLLEQNGNKSWAAKRRGVLVQTCGHS